MNKTTQYHIGNLLTALSAFGQHLMGAAPAEVETLPAEPTTDKPKGPGRPRKPAEPAPAEAAKPADPAPAPTPAPAAPAAAPVGGLTFDQLKEATRPLHESGQGQELIALIKKHIPADGDKEGRLRELARWPEAHAAFMKEVTALIPVKTGDEEY